MKKENPFTLLVSYGMIRESADKKKIWEMVANCHEDLEILIDSGAFTALNAGRTIDVEEYMKFIDEWKDRIFGYLALDVIGDPQASERNLKIMLSNGFKPIPVHVRGDDGKRMDELFDVSSYVACGGLRRPHRGQATLAYLKQKMLWAAGRDVHWLGYTGLPAIRAFRPFSCDSSSWSLGAQKFGQLRVYIGDGKWVDRGPYSSAMSRAFSTEERAVFERCGFSLIDVRDPRHWRIDIKSGITPMRHIPFCVGTHSWVRYVRWIRSEFGTRFFLACPLILRTEEHLLEFIKESKCEST